MGTWGHVRSHIINLSDATQAFNFIVSGFGSRLNSKSKKKNVLCASCEARAAVCCWGIPSLEKAMLTNVAATVTAATSIASNIRRNKKRNVCAGVHNPR